MAEAKTTSSAPASDAGEAPVERAPAELKASTQESATEPTKENTTKNANGAEEKSAESTTAQEDKKESSDAAAEKSNTSGESAEAKKSDEGATAPAESQSAAASEPNGTPASTKKASSKRKSTGGDTKSKLNRKKSQSRITHLDAKPGDYFLARLRSFPPWPAIVCDEEILPQTLLDTRPVTAQREDGTYREDYADGGKRVAERTFPVMFFQTNEFAWITNTDLTPLDPATCKDVSEKGKSKSLVAAYGVAAEHHDLAHFKDMLANHQRAIQQEEEELEAQAAAKASAKAERDAKKNKRKSMDIHDDVDLEDAGEGGKQPKSAKKRKKDAVDEADEKPAKTPKTGTKLKLTTPKNPADEGGKKAPASSKAKQSASKKGKKAAASDESDESRPVSKEPQPQVNLEESKKKREREVLFVRHRLQKGFISRDHPPKEEEMSQMSNYFNKLEKLNDLEVSIIRDTKINKVLKLIIKLPNIPRDEEFNFRKRALDILSKWKAVIDGESATPGQEKEKDEKPRANGVHKEEDGAETLAKNDPKSEKEDDTKLDTPDQDTPMPDAEKEKTEETPAPAKSDAEKVAPETAESEKEKEKPVEEKSEEEKTAEVAA